VLLIARTAAPSSVLDRARVLVALMVVQGAIGYTQYFSHLPALLVGVHVFGAAVVWVAMLWFYDGLTHHGGDRRRADADSGGIANTVPVPDGTANTLADGMANTVPDGMANPVPDAVTTTVPR
jgi:hypothetical protein